MFLPPPSLLKPPRSGVSPTAATGLRTSATTGATGRPTSRRNLILRYTAPGDVVLDQMAGSGTTLVECKLLERCAVGVDINPDAVMMARNRLDFAYTPMDVDY